MVRRVESRWPVPLRHPASNRSAPMRSWRVLCGRPTGKSVKGLSSPVCKNILIFRRAKSAYTTEGRLEIVTNAGQDAVDACSAEDEGAWLADGEVVWSCSPALFSLA